MQRIIAEQPWITPVIKGCNIDFHAVGEYIRIVFSSVGTSNDQINADIFVVCPEIELNIIFTLPNLPEGYIVSQGIYLEGSICIREGKTSEVFFREGRRCLVNIGLGCRKFGEID